MKNNMIKKIAAVLLVGLLSMSLMACGSNKESKDTTDTAKKETNSNAAETKEAVTETSTGIPLTSSDLKVVIGEQGYREIPIILEKGWFEEVFGASNIEIEVARFNNGPEMIEAFTAGQLDVAPMGMQPGISGAANDAGVSIIGSFCDSQTGIILASLKESGITTVADLKGKKVGTTIGSSAYSLLLKALNEEGLSIDKDVSFVNIEFASAPTAIESGELDAAIGYADAFEQVIQADGDIFNIIKDATGYGISENILVARNEFAKEHADVVENILALYERANEFINENRDEAVAINAKYYGLDEEVVRTSAARYTYEWLSEDTLTKDIDDYIQFMFDNGLISERLDVKDVIDFSYYNEAFGK